MEGEVEKIRGGEVEEMRNGEPVEARAGYVGKINERK